MFSSDLLKGKRALITGGATGLGKAMARRYLELGATVYICGRREEVLQEAVAELAASVSHSYSSWLETIADSSRTGPMA